MPQDINNTIHHSLAIRRGLVLMVFALNIGFECQAQQLTVSSPLRTDDIVLTAFNIDVHLAAGAELPGTGTWKFSGTDEIELSNAVGDNAWFPNVQLLNNVGLRLADGPMHIRGVLRFGQGILRTGDQEVVFGPTASTSNARNVSHIDGLISKEGLSNFVFPLGSNGAYHPLEIFDLSGGSSAFRARYFAEGHPDPLGPWFDGNNWPVSTCDYWQLQRAEGDAEASVRLDWSESDCNEVNDNQYMRVSRYIAGEWELLPSAVDSPSDESVSTSSSQSAFGDFALASIGNGVNVLPIDLLHFGASANAKGTVQCLWTTATEINNDYFELERSADGFNWESVEKIMGAGFSNTALQYQHTDARPLPGQSYYRLRQVDFDGTATVYEPVAVYIDAAHASLSIDKTYRSEQGLRIHYQAHEGPVHTEIFDLYGKRVFSTLLQGDLQTALTSPQLRDGLYILRMSQGGESASLKFKW